jgi:hypothetical protein
VATPVVLFGPFDRHNLGDLLFPHVAAALLPGRTLRFAGLAARDLRPQGGHAVRALAELTADQDERPAALIHVGGEILTCTAWEAAVMLLPPEQVDAAVAYLDARPHAKRRWARALLGVPDRAPYMAARALLPRVTTVVYAAVGGVALDACTPAMRSEVIDKLKGADALAVRDRRTRAHLEAEGVAARLIPDPAVMVAELFGAPIRKHGGAGEPREVLRRFPHGYIAVQLSADFGDDQTLNAVAAQLDAIAPATGLGVVLFRAGAAPWHDDLGCYRRIVSRMRTAAVCVFQSLDIWDICALIAASSVYCGSSLHGRIVATAFARPRVSVRSPAPIPMPGKLSVRSPAPNPMPGKQDAYASTWEAAVEVGTVEVERIAEAIRVALGAAPAGLHSTARRLAGEYRRWFGDVAGRLQ